MIKSISCNSFLGLRDFHLTFNKFNCLVGMNGSGKTTILSFIEFLCSLVLNHDFFDEDYSKVEFCVEFSDDVVWSGVFDPATQICIYEKLVHPDCVVEVFGGKVLVNDKLLKVNKYFGSIISVLDIKEFNNIKEYFTSYRDIFSRNKRLESTSQLLILDNVEYENNSLVDSMKMEEFVKHILSHSSQIFVSTHNVLFLNYLEDEIAIESVIYVYNRKNRITAIPLFSIPSMREKLTVMGVGEAYIDTDLDGLNNEI